MDAMILNRCRNPVVTCRLSTDWGDVVDYLPKYLITDPVLIFNVITEKLCGMGFTRKRVVLQKRILSYNRMGYFDGTETLLKIGSDHLGMWHIPEIICSAPEFHQVCQDNMFWFKFCEKFAERIQQWRLVH